MRCHGTKCPLLLKAFFSSLLSLFPPLGLLFSQKGLSKGSEILHGVLSRNKNRIWGSNKIGEPLPPGGQLLLLFFLNEKCLESPEMARKIIGNLFLPPPSQTLAKMFLKLNFTSKYI